MMKNFFDYDANNPAERQERYAHYPELSKFHMALQDELSDDEYETYFESEKQLITQTPLANTVRAQWIR